MIHSQVIFVSTSHHILKMGIVIPYLFSDIYIIIQYNQKVKVQRKKISIDYYTDLPGKFCRIITAEDAL